MLCPVPAWPPTHAFMLLPLPLSTMYGVFWAFCFSWSNATVPRGVSLELIFFRSCGARQVSTGGRPSISHNTRKCGAHTSQTYRLLIQLLHPALGLHLA